MAGIGDIGVRVSADTTDFASGMNRTEQIAAKSMARVAQAQRIAQQASDKFVNSLKFQADTFGKTDTEILKYKADLLGAGDAAAPLIARLEELKKASAAATSTTQIRASAHEMEGLSFATAGAKRELLVLAHELSQGNFSRFGGSLLVLGERTGAAALLFNPLTLGILASGAALAALGYQVYKGHADWVALGDSIKSTGDYTGYTQRELDQMSVHFARSTQEIQAGREALTALIATGRFSGDELAKVGRVALDMASDTGKSIEDVTKELAKLPDGARKWADEYQKTHHVFTAANIELIDSLDKQGKQAQATAAVLDALNEAHKRVGDTMRKDKGTWDRFWDDWADGLARIRDGLRDIGRPDSDFEKINAALLRRESLQSALALSQKRLDGSGGKDPALAKQVEQIQIAIQANLGLIESLRKTDDAKRQAAKNNAALAQGGDNKIKVDAYLDGGSKSDKQKYADKVAAENKSFQETIANLQKNTKDYEAVVRHHKENLAEIEKEYAKKTKPKEYQDDAATKYLQTLRDQDAQLKAQLRTSNNMTAAQKEQAAFEQKIADFAGKKLTKEQESLLANKDAIRAQLAKNVADAEDLRIKTEVTKLDEKSAQINEQIASNQAARAEQYQRQLGAFGMGKEAQGKVAAVQSLYKEYQRYEDQLTKSTSKDMLGSKKYLDEVAAIHGGLTQSLADYDTYYAELKAKQGDWTNGATQSMQDYMDAAQNVAAQVGSAFTSAFKGAEDAFVSFVTTGKASFSSLANSILSDLARIAIRKAEAGLISLAADAFGSTFGPGTIGDLSGARAAGGPVSSGGTYLVGENGPELFKAPSSGTIIPNHALGGGGGLQINIETHISGNGASSQTSGGTGDARALGDALGARIKGGIVQEMRQGGSIWNYLNKGVPA